MQIRDVLSTWKANIRQLKESMVEVEQTLA